MNNTVPMKWWEGYGTESSVVCVCCGKEILGSPKYVEVIDGGESVAKPGTADEKAPDYMGGFPVGAGCAKKHFKGFYTSTPVDNDMKNAPYAMFRFGGEIVELNERQFCQAIRDSRHCHCGNCLVCRVAEYAKETATKEVKDV